MRFLLAFALCFVSVFASAQVPMVLGGPQGIDVTRILARNWMSIPTYTDTPAAPLTGSGWPARGFIIHVAKAGDTAVWQYTGKKWAKIGGVAENNYTYLVSGGGYTKALSSNNITVKASTYYIKGLFYSSSLVILPGFPKTANSNGRIDAVVLGSSGASIIQGTESANPASPAIPDDKLKIGFIYYPPFDTLPQVTGSELTSVFRKPGRDSLYFTSGDTTIAVKDSIGIAPSDTASMLTNYVNTASNGLTKTGKDVRLGGTLNQATRIALNGNNITIVGSSDSSRFFSNGSLSVGYRNQIPSDDFYKFSVNGRTRFNGVASYTGDLLPEGTPNAYSIGLLQGANFGSIVGYSNNGISPRQQLEFGNYTTSLNTNNILNGVGNNNYGFRIYGGSALPVDSGGGSYTNFRISPTINYNLNLKKAIHMGLSYEPTVQSLNNTTHIAFRNTRGSNLFNVNSGNTLIGYDTTSAAYQVDTTYKLDVNGNMRVGRIFYGANNVDTALVIRKANGSGTAPGIYIGGANSFNVSPLNPTYVYGDLNSITGTSAVNTVIGHLNNIDSSVANIVLGDVNNIPNPTSTHILIGARHTGNSYTNGQNAAILIGRENNTNGYWGSGLIGSSLKYYDNGQLAFGGNSSNVNFATRNVYFGNGVKNENNNVHGNFGHGPDVAINPSWANDVDSANRNGGSLTIAGGRGTGTGTPGTVRFSTWNTTTSGSTLHPTLTERARISERGNLLVGTSTDDTSSIVNIVSTAKGFLQPRMTNTQRDAITTPATGLQLFSTTDSANYVYRGTGGGWQKIANEISGSATLDFPSTNGNNKSDLVINGVTGVSEGDVVSLGVPNGSVVDHSCYTAWVSATNQVTVRFSNYGTGALDPASGTFKIKVFK